MERRLILAIALSVLIIVTFQYVVGKPQVKPEMERPQQVQPAHLTQEAEGKAYPPREALSEEKEFDVETDRYILTFSNIGGSIKTVRLKDYKKSDSNEPLDLVKIDNPKEYIFAISDRLNSLPLDSSSYESEEKENIITYSLRTKDIEIIKRYILHNSKYAIELQLIIKNISAGPKELSYRIINGSGIIEPQIQDRRFIEVMSNIDGRAWNFKRPRNGKIINPGIVSWSALKNKYFSIIMKPLVETTSQFYYETKDANLVSGIEPKAVTISPDSSVEHKFILYAGPGKLSTLKDFGFEETINYGFFGGISKLLLSVLGFFYMLVRNWGASIILLSIFLNLILFPLSIKSFKSMQKMQALHPQMEKLKSQYKGNPQKLNKEIMELYKKYKINPFSGCLPLILQMPIFIALYQSLIRSIELRNAQFLWIKDLSMPDGVKIPFTLPILGNSINILPIIMIISMVVQQKISTKSMGGAVTNEQKQQQQMMLILMPLMFGFIFYNMPSGLVLYWVVNTFLTIFEQSMMVKKA